MKYKEGFKDIPVSMNPYIENIMEPNFWLSCLIIDKDAMCKQVRSDNEALYIKEKGKSCPTEILEVLEKYNVEGRPIWKPMHMQPMYRMNDFVKRDDISVDVGADIFDRGLCLPSDIKMTEDEQDIIIKLIVDCFK